MMEKLLVATLLCSGLAAGPASAQMYLGAGIGAAETDTSQTSYKLFGGSRFTPTWGLEIAYTDLSKYNGANFESASLAGTGTLPLDENWSLLGKLGASSNRSHFAGSSRHTDLLRWCRSGIQIQQECRLAARVRGFRQTVRQQPREQFPWQESESGLEIRLLGLDWGRIRRQVGVRPRPCGRERHNFG